MTYEEFKEKNLTQLEKDWCDGECDDYANFTSYVWHKWQESGDCDYAK